MAREWAILSLLDLAAKCSCTGAAIHNALRAAKTDNLPS